MSQQPAVTLQLLADVTAASRSRLAGRRTLRAGSLFDMVAATLAAAADFAAATAAAAVGVAAVRSELDGRS